jgi:hypothetical protein
MEGKVPANGRAFRAVALRIGHGLDIMRPSSINNAAVPRRNPA